MHQRTFLSGLPLLGLVVFGAASAQDPSLGQTEGKSVEIVRAATPPVIDGVLDDPVWSRAPVIEDLHQINPVEYNSPSERTEIRMAYDEDALYVSARLWDSEADRITAQVLRQGEGLGSEDRFAIILDPYLDRRSGYRFQINANSVRWDALYQDTSDLESNWEGIWQGRATRDEAGWSAEIAIPFKTLSFNPNNDTWGVNFERTIQRKDEQLAWVSRNRQLNPGVAGTVRGFEGLQQGRGLDIVPSVSVVDRTFYGGGEGSSDLEPSLDVFYKITPALNGSLTLNTDFSATEVDDRQVNLTRFSLFFPEKRDFFLQDSDIFEFGRIGGGGGFNGGGGNFGGGGGQNGRPFFSRTIGLGPTGQPVDLQYGGKLSGRVGGRWNVGALAVRQDAFADVDETDIFVGRVTANVLGESNVGVIVTDGDPHSNLDSQTVGTDFRYRNTRLPGRRVLEAEAWYQESDNEGTAGDDRAWGFGIDTPNNTGWRGGFKTSYIGEAFDPAVGFVNESGIRNYSADFGYRHRFRETDRLLRSVFSGLSASRVERIDTGMLDRRDVSLEFNLEGSAQDRMFANLSRNEENIPFDFPIYTASDGSQQVILPAGNYVWDYFFMGIRTGNQRKISAFMGTGTGEYYDGHRTQINMNMNWRPSEHLRLGASYSTNDISLPGGDFIVRLASIDAQYVFSSTLSWVNLIQYDNFSETIGFNSRLHWIPEAGREGFIVFNHSLADRDKNDSFHSTNADISIKFSYTWRF